MTNYIILALCLVILLAYLFDITSKYTKVPGVILLIGLGIIVQLLADKTGLKIPDLEPMLPVIGTVGLVLIVMEASMDLKLGKDKIGLIVRSVSAAVFLFALFTAIMTFVISKFLNYTVFDSLLNAIPFGIISSAVAISSAGNLKEEQREFVIYESSVSDIVGILVFDFIVLYQDSIGYGLFNYAVKGLITLIVAVLFTSALAMLMHKITYHINYVIIMTSVVLVYALAKIIHLPALLLVLAFGIALANHRLVQKTPIRKYVDFDKFGNDLLSFKRIMTELTFVVRSFFFIMFGYYTMLEGLFSIQNILTALLIVVLIYMLRIIFLWKFLKTPVFPFLFFSPRGLITILLFLSIPAASRINLINEQVVTLVILLTIVLMMAGNIFYKKEREADFEPAEPGERTADPGETG